MSQKQELNRVIITDKGVEISKDIKKDVLNSIQDPQWEEKARQNRLSITPTNVNLPLGYQAQVQSQLSVNLISKPFRTTFMANAIASSIPQKSSAFGSTVTLTNSIYQPLQTNEYQAQQALGRTQNRDGWARSSFIGTSTNKSGFGSSTFYAVNNKKHLSSQISVKSLGGMKLNLTNFNYTNELQNQNAHQKQQMQTVQQERLSKKFTEWNEQFMKSNELMKNKYYQKYEDIGKLGDKEDEDNFWKQWRTIRQSCDQCIQSAELEQLRFEESILRKLNKKYKNAFKTLPQCAKIEKPKQLPKIPSSNVKQ